LPSLTLQPYPRTHLKVRCLGPTNQSPFLLRIPFSQLRLPARFKPLGASGSKLPKWRCWKDTRLERNCTSKASVKSHPNLVSYPTNNLVTKKKGVERSETSIGEWVTRQGWENAVRQLKWIYERQDTSPKDR
jgi:hypothetical protein